MAIVQTTGRNLKLPFSGGAAGFTPASLPSLAIWLDPSNASSVTVVSNNVQQINDLSGNLRHFQAPAAAQRPTYTGTLNGLRVMGFVSGNPSELDCVSAFSLGPSLTVCVVEKATTLAAFAGTVALDNTSTVRVAQHRWDSATAPSTVYFPSGTDVAGAAAPDITAGAHTFMSVLDDAAHTVTNYIDGTANGTASGVAALASGSLAWQLGRTTTTGANWWNGPIGEVIICNTALTAQDRSNLVSYLRTKWGTP